MDKTNYLDEIVPKSKRFGSLFAARYGENRLRRSSQERGGGAILRIRGSRVDSFRPEKRSVGQLLSLRKEKN